MIGHLSFEMIEVPLKTQLLIGIITFLVFSYIIKLIIKILALQMMKGETLINLNKLGRRHRSNKK